MESTAHLNPASLEIPLQLINNALAPCTIYTFGHRCQSNNSWNALVAEAGTSQPTHHACLLVFTNAANPNSALDLANLVREQTRGAVTVTLLVHKPADLATAQPDQQWFLWSVLRNAQRLCLDKTAIPYWPHTWDPGRDIKAARAYWLKCEAVAGFHINAAAASEHVDVELVKIALLHQAAEQIALGLISTFMGYTPNQYSLQYLLALCSHFTQLPTTVFPQSTRWQQKRFKQLCAPPSMLRHWIHLDASEADFTYLLDACTQFLDAAAELAAAELVRVNQTPTLNPEP
ncbi:MAG TPA: hypothetical protein VGB67_04455 [Fibrella sp.]